MADSVTVSYAALKRIHTGLFWLLGGSIIFSWLILVEEDELFLFMLPFLIGIAVIKSGVKMALQSLEPQQAAETKPQTVEQDHAYIPPGFAPKVAEKIEEPQATVRNIYAEEEQPEQPVAPQTLDEVPQDAPAKHVKEPVKKVEINWEEWVGQKLLQKLGIVIVLIGMIVLLKYSFDNGWIGPHGRIALSMLAACGLIGAGEWFQSKYDKWAQSFTGGGLALLYFTVWAMHVFYAGKLAFTISSPLAMMLYSFITAIGVFGAIRYKSQPIAWFAMLGGYATPFLIEGASNVMGFVTYLAILAAGMLILAWHQKWRYINIAAFVFTNAYLFGKIYSLPHTIFSDGQQIIIAIGFFLLFGLLPFLYQFKLGTKTELDDIALTIGNGLAVFIPVLDAIGGIDSQFTGLVCLCLAAVYLGYAALALQKVTEDDLLINTYLIGSVIMVALALLAELEPEWVAVGWAPFSALLVYISVRLQRTGPWRCAGVLLAGSIFFLSMHLPGMEHNPEMLWQPFTSTWSLQSYIVFASLVAWIYLSQKLPHTLLTDESKYHASTVLHSIFAALLLIFVTLNCMAIGSPGIENVIDIPLAVGYLAFTVIAISLFVLSRSIVWFFFACAAQALVLIFTFAIGEGSGMVWGITSRAIIHPWAGISVLAFLMTIGMGYTALSLDDKRINTPQMHMLLLGVALAQIWVHVSVEIQHLAHALSWSALAYQRVLSGWWILFALGITGWGYQKEQEKIVGIGVGLLILPFLKDLFAVVQQQTDFYEMAVWTLLPLIGSVLCTQKKYDNAVKNLIAYTVVFGAIDMLHMHVVWNADNALGMGHTAWWTVASIVFFTTGSRLRSDNLLYGGIAMLCVTTALDMLPHLAEAQGMVRSIWWALAALVTIGIGFAEKQQVLRKVGIGIFGATTVKLLIFDFSMLTTPVRIVASIATGLLMIGASYLYQRFGNANNR